MKYSLKTTKIRLFMLVWKKKKSYVQTICFFWQAEHIVHHPQVAGSHRRIYIGNRAWNALKRESRGSVLFTGMEMGVMSKLLNQLALFWKLLCYICMLSLFNLLVFWQYMSHRKKPQTSISNKAHRLGTNVDKMDQNGRGESVGISLG